MTHFSVSGRLAGVYTAWLALGFAWLLLGMFVLPASKLYQQGLIVFFWLPGLLSVLCLPPVRKAADPLIIGAFLLCAIWAGLSVYWGGEAGRLKEIMYVGFALMAVLALSALNSRLFWLLLLACALSASVFAWWAVFDFYLIQGRPWEERVVATGLLDHTILASQVIGVFGLVLLFMRAWWPQQIPRWVWLSGCLGCVLFLLMSRSKGPLLALLVCLLLSGLWTVSWRALAGGVLAVVVAVIAALSAPEVLLREGLSYRPELLAEAWKLWLKSPWLGIGNGVEYQLPVYTTGKFYDHAHNLYAHIAVQLGSVGLLLWGGLLAVVAWRAWHARRTVPGMMLCGVCVFSWVGLLTDGIGPWVKPREEWFTVWLPVFLALALSAKARMSGCKAQTGDAAA